MSGINISSRLAFGRRLIQRRIIRGWSGGIETIMRSSLGRRVEGDGGWGRG